MQPEDDQDLENDILITCALRFDGYKYKDATGIGSSDGFLSGLMELSEPVVERLELHSDPDRNHAAFFALQRFLYKWGGDYLSISSREHLAFRFLFLDLYKRDVPAEFRHQEYWERWQKRYEPRKEHYAGIIRNTFCRKGCSPDAQM
jgi:hypothetical protein